MIEDAVRSRLAALAERRGVSLAALSRLLDRDPSYLRNFVNRGSPRVLPEQCRRTLSDFFGVAEEELGGPARPIAFRLPRLDVAASAGPGALVDGDTLLGTEAIEPGLARTLGLKKGRAAVIRVRGSSMEPGLMDGDHIVVDQTDTEPGARGGVYVIRLGEALMVKRVAGAGGLLVARSDNPLSPPLPDEPIAVIGRVVWQMRRPV